MSFVLDTGGGVSLVEQFSPGNDGVSQLNRSTVQHDDIYPVCLQGTRQFVSEGGRSVCPRFQKNTKIIITHWPQPALHLRAKQVYQPDVFQAGENATQSITKRLDIHVRDYTIALLHGLYDISNDRRRTKLHNLLLDYGSPVQYSVFECLLDAERLKKLKQAVRKVIRPGRTMCGIIGCAPSASSGWR